LLSPDLIRYILDPDNEYEGFNHSRKADCDNPISKFNISDFNKVKNECNFLETFFKKYFLRNI